MGSDLLAVVGLEPLAAVGLVTFDAAAGLEPIDVVVAVGSEPSSIAGLAPVVAADLFQLAAALDFAGHLAVVPPAVPEQSEVAELEDPEVVVDAFVVVELAAVAAEFVAVVMRQLALQAVRKVAAEWS